MTVSVQFKKSASLETEARDLARTHALAPGAKPTMGLRDRVQFMPAWLETVKSYCQNPDPAHSRAADWLLDNDYQILRAIRQVDEDLPMRFYRRLPVLADPAKSNFPRAHALALAILDTTRLQLSAASIVTYMRAYEEVSALSLAELWALPSMLRLECLGILGEAFHRLNPDLAPLLEPAPYMPDGHMADPTDRISRAIASLGVIQTIEWRDIVDRISLVETILGRDPAKVYARMDFDTRDRYRHIVEELAEGSKVPEAQVAEEVVTLSKQPSADGRRRHVGYWLIGDGLPELEAKLRFKAPFQMRLHRRLERNAHLIYAAALAIFSLAALVVPVADLVWRGAGPWALIGGIALALLPVTVLSVAIVHWMITAFTAPRMLPMMDFRKGIPEDFPTAVVIPLILADASEIPAFIEGLETRRLSNPDPMLRFVLLTDLADADAERMPADAAIEEALATAVRNLNAQYGGPEGGPFFLMHRARRYNPAEGCWMAWERKRGKLEQFNSFVVGEPADGFAVTEGDIARLRGLRFVITLDDDTTLPPETAARLIGALAHPLNRASFDPVTGRVVSGYTIIQPRIEILPQTRSVSVFCRLYSGDTAIDIYSRAVSDVYQDLFGSGIFVGKGIYEVATFRQSLHKRMPQNAILSHDLIEGVYGRTALASNIVLYEDYPSTYPEYALRLHRWVRGDWQLVPWLGRQVPVADGLRAPNPLSGLDRWKIIDNLRRSVVAPALLLLFVGGWMIVPGSVWLWTIFAAAVPGAYLLGGIFSGLARDVRRGLAGDLAHRLVEKGGRWFLSIAFLVSDTFVSLDAVFRTLWRVFVNRRHLLEWRSAAHVSARLKNDSVRRATWRLMWPSSVFSAVVGTNLALYGPATFLPAMPILALWFAAPEIAIWLGKPVVPRRETLDDTERGFLRHVARRSWLYFETFVGPGDNWLPPDNFQEDPKGEVAHRTSPTNIGFYLTSAVSALELGFIGTRDFSARASNTLDSLARMKTYRGHLLNWYDTTTLEPLEPQYVSTVDSGNLAICLVALKQASIDATSRPACGAEMWDGLAGTFDILIGVAGKLGRADTAELDRRKTEFRAALARAGENSERWLPVLEHISSVFWPELETMIGRAIEKSELTPQRTLAEVHIWLERFQHHVLAMQRDLNTYLPWLALIERPPAGQEELARRIAGALGPEIGLNEVRKTGNAYRDIVKKAIVQAGADEDTARWLGDVDAAIGAGITARATLQVDLFDLARRADGIAFGMDFAFLYDPDARLFRIGYNDSTGQLDANHYDLLATEARLASFFAIAKHDVPLEHWFFLGRPMTRLAGKPSILSWNGSMFEYLMAPLFLPSRRETLLGESEATAVEFQRRYAMDRGVPWGISESAFGITDADGNYQYRAFGAPGLGLRRGLAKDLVVAPYASALALCCWPKAAVQNLRRFSEIGAAGTYGYFDALDYTPSRVPEGREFIPVRVYMAHHHGMTIGAIVNALKDDLLAQAVLADKRMRTVALLLQERVPWDAPIEKGRIDERLQPKPGEGAFPLPAPWVPALQASVPQTQMLGNGRMAAWMSASGAGRLSWRNEALTRWVSDPTRDAQGYWIYVRDADSGNVWSVGRQPCGRPGQDAKTIFHQHMVEMFRRDDGIAIRMDVTVATGDDIEIRRITVVNEGDAARRIEFTSYAEVALAPPADDERHPAFSKLFTGSSFIAEYDGLLFERRPRRPEIRHPLLLHRLVFDDPGIELAGYETDRARFVGRNGNMRQPPGLAGELTQTTGWTLDPIMALRARVRLDPMETKQFTFATIAGRSRASILEVAERYSSPSFDGVFLDARREAAREAGRLEFDPARLPEIQALASLLVHSHPVLREVPAGIDANSSGQPNLWQFGISGDVPILVLRMGEDEPSDLLELLIRAQRLWARGGLVMDLVVLRTEAAGYEEPLRERILSILRDTHASEFLERTGGIHLLSANGMAPSSRRGLEAAAHVVLDDDGAPLAGKLDRALERRARPPHFTATAVPDHEPMAPLEKPTDLIFDNGFGGFDPRTGDYLIHLDGNETTPAPWCNILANDDFGTIVSESGLGFTWAVNSGENRLTPWSNDPVADPPGEVLYLRDEETAEFWTVTPAPLGGGSPCRIRHGAGYTSWTRAAYGLECELLVFVAADDPVKIARLRLTNPCRKVRRITATYYAEWLLGALASRSKPHVGCEYDPSCHAILATNAWNPEFAGRVAFLAASRPPHSVTGDRYDFLGSESDPDRPAAMRHWDLGGRFTPGGDACAAYQVHLDIEAGETAEVVFVLGQGATRDAARTLIERWTDTEQVEHALGRVRELWAERLGAVTVKTPDPAFDLMTNRWLIYQVVASRLMARAGFYQAGGAFGFRDQLQDVLALLPSDPRRARSHILKAARHQFEHGDALHWWHPPSGRGVKTRCSDDYLWLAYVTARYVEATGDHSILDEDIPFLAAAPLRADEHDRYAHFETGETGNLFEHCCRALNRMMATGPHGLPLIGTGDWNDGMDRIGDKGLGESVWLAWFQIATINLYAPLASKRGHRELAGQWRAHSKRLKDAIGEMAWDGNWFVRAFDDDGTPWGSYENDECRIDLIAQSWGVMAGLADEDRVKTAMASAGEKLVRHDDRLVLLLAPPFHDTRRDPGYIKAYPPGIRENGGQYTHAAAWMGHAFAGLGDGDAAWRIFDIINPIRRSNTRETALHYRCEPYVLPGDVAGPGQNLGRGGWSWYSGAAGWTWQLGVAGILGIRLRNGAISIDPCLPKEWGAAEATLKGPKGTIYIRIEDPGHAGRGIAAMTVDGKPGRKRMVRFPRRNRTRHVVITLGRPQNRD